LLQQGRALDAGRPPALALLRTVVLPIVEARHRLVHRGRQPAQPLLVGGRGRVHAEGLALVDELVERVEDAGLLRLHGRTIAETSAGYATFTPMRAEIASASSSQVCTPPALPRRQNTGSRGASPHGSIRSTELLQPPARTGPTYMP